MRRPSSARRHRRGRQGPLCESTRVAFDENRRAIDAILEQKRQLARLSPDDLELQDALFLAYRRKLELYQDAALKEGL